MKPLPQRCVLLALVAAFGVFPEALWSASAADETAGRVWKHPHEWYHQQIKRTRDLPPGLQYSEVRLALGDHEHWARPDWDDRGWQVGNFLRLPARAGVFWARFRVRLNDPERELAAGFFTSSHLAYEIYWDGVLVVRNGIPGDSTETETPGRLDNIVSLSPQLLGPGEHVVAVRASSQHCAPHLPFASLVFLVDAPADAHAAISRFLVPPLAVGGALLMISVAVAFVGALAGRRRALLALAGLCFAAAAQQFVWVFRWVWGYSYDWQPVAQALTASSLAAMSLFLVGFAVTHFAVPRGRTLFVAFAPVLALATWLGADREKRSALLVGLVAAALISGWAALRRRPGAGLAFLGFAVSAVVLAQHWHYSVRVDFYLMFLPAMLGIIATVGLQLRADHREAREARLMATRLEIELLKKNLQPHFLLNTLTALMEVIEQEPRLAVKLIDDLAGEFRLMAAMSAEKTVPLAQEIELCRAHLRVMSVRIGTECTLEVEGSVGERRVPPALFLTLIENGFSHQRVRGAKAVFRLRCEPLNEHGGGGGKDGVRYAFVSPGEVHADPARRTGGTGLRYVRARLEESSSGAWSFRDGPAGDGWETTIEIAEARAAPAGR